MLRLINLVILTILILAAVIIWAGIAEGTRHNSGSEYDVNACRDLFNMGPSGRAMAYSAGCVLEVIDSGIS